YRFICLHAPCLLPPFPTRRSSDLSSDPAHAPRGAGTPRRAAARLPCAPATSTSSPPTQTREARRYRLRLVQARAQDRHSVFRQSDRKSTRLNSSHVKISYAVFCLK